MQYSRIMSVDFGDTRIGIAFSDLLQILSNPYEVYYRQNEEADLMYLSNLAHSNNTGKIIIGLPLEMDGMEGERVAVTKKFGDKLAQISKIEVVYHDERLSSVEADEILRENRVHPKDRKKILDKLAAAIILQSYLNSKK